MRSSPPSPARRLHYEEAGALRDMVQNHLLQVLAFVAMEPPDSLAPEDVRDRTAELVEAVRPFSANGLVSGQYAAGVVEGHEVRIQPDEGISLVFRTKEPGPGMALDAVPMDFSYGGSFRSQPAEAYERLLHDAMA